MLSKAHTLLVSVFISLFFAQATEGAKPKVFWSGFAFKGMDSELRVRYPHTYSLNEIKDDIPILNKYFNEYFSDNRSKLIRINLEFGVADFDEVTLALSLVMTDEQVLNEKLGDIYKSVIQLGFELIVLDFKKLEVVCSQPIFIEYRDASSKPFSDNQIQERIQSMVAGSKSQLAEVLASKMQSIQILANNQGTLRVKEVLIGEKAKPFLPKKYTQGAIYNQIVAQQFGLLMASEGQVAMLPYSKDKSNSSMSLVFSDGSLVQFKIPEPTFAIDLNLRGFKKVQSKKTAAEALWVYGAFLDVKVYEPEFEVDFFNQQVKYGVQKIVPVSQKAVDEFPVVSEALKGVCVQAIGLMKKDKKTKEKVLKKCKY